MRLILLALLILFVIIRENYALNGQWNCNKDNLKINDTTLVIEKETSFKCIFRPSDGGIVSGKHFFELQFYDQTNGHFGVTSENNYMSRNHITRGLYYGGLGVLYDGYLDVVDFGEKKQANDTIGMLIDYENGDLKIYYFHNKHPLGLAFHLTNVTVPIYPSTTGYLKTKMTISKSDPIPTLIDRQPRNYTAPAGDYFIDKCEQNGELKSNENWKNFSCEITPRNSRMFPSEHQKAESSNTESADYTVRCYLVNVEAVSLIRTEDGNYTIPKFFYSFSYLHDHFTDYEERSKAAEFVNLIFDKYKSIRITQNQLEFLATGDRKMILKRFNKPPPKPYIPKTTRCFLC